MTDDKCFGRSYAGFKLGQAGMPVLKKRKNPSRSPLRDGFFVIAYLLYYRGTGLNLKPAASPLRLRAPSHRRPRAAIRRNFVAIELIGISSRQRKRLV